MNDYRRFVIKMATGSGKTSDRKLLPLDQVRPATGGSKADAARHIFLTGLSGLSG
ncbi:MAG: hypothetical protein U9Q89_00280 [Thermodesulfobacteriota bacterium]|nr:hypothetical protein [Thermodesulfobacteriota bacterium]